MTQKGVSERTSLAGTNVSQRYEQIAPTACGNMAHLSRAFQVPHKSQKTFWAGDRTIIEMYINTYTHPEEALHSNPHYRLCINDEVLVCEKRSGFLELRVKVPPREE